MVLHALGRAGCAPSQLEVLFLNQGLPDFAFTLPDFLRSNMEPVLQNMSTLLLSVDLSDLNFFAYPDNSADVVAGRALRRFLSYTPNLTHLRLNFRKAVVDYNQSFLKWLGQPIPAPGQQSTSGWEIQPIALPSLKQLDFGQLDANRPSLLLAITAKFASTLKELNFWKMGLVTETGFSHDHRPNYWKDFIRRLAKIPQLKLTHLKMGMLQQDSMYVGFKIGNDENASTLKQREYTGQEMDKFMDELIEQVSVPWPEPVVQDEGTDGDEEMSDDYEDEGEEEDDEDEGEDV